MSSSPSKSNIVSSKGFDSSLPSRYSDWSVSSTSSHDGSNTNDGVSKKLAEIEHILSQPDVDLWKLRECCLSNGGLLNDQIRKRAWPQLLGVHHVWLEEDDDSSDDTSSLDDIVDSDSQAEETPNNDTSAAFKDSRQIELDVTRCTWHLLTGNQRSLRIQMEHKRHKKIARVIRRKQRRLAHLIHTTLVASYKKRERLCYYQGYHDVACIFLSTLGGSSRGMVMPSACLYQISQFQLCDPMQNNFEPLQTTIRLSLFPLLAYFDREIHDVLVACDMEPFFALSWMITWFAHDVRDTDAVKRLFDAFIVSHPLLPLYIAIAMMCHPFNRHEILNTPHDFSALHQVLTDLPKNSNSWGWKYRPGDGYISDDDDDDESVNSTSTCTTSGASIDGDLLVMELDQDDFISSSESDVQDATSVSSCVSSLELISSVKVPFQSLIDQALELMRQVPPRDIMVLSRRYYGAKFVDQNMETLSKLPTYLQSESPEWSMASTGPADWLLKQWVREKRLDGKSLSRSQQRRQKGLRKNLNDNTSATMSVYAKKAEHSSKPSKAFNVIKPPISINSKAWIATGLGPSGRDEKRQALKRQKRITTMIVAAIMVVSLFGLAGVVSAAMRMNRTSSRLQFDFSPPRNICELAPPQLPWERFCTNMY